MTYAAWVHHYAEKLTIDALRKREAALVEYWTPTVRRMSLDMLGTNALPATPRTLEDLSRPIVLVLNGFGALLDSSETDPHQP